MQGIRTIVITIDALMDLLKDYTADLQDIPADAKAVKLMIKPTEQGKFGIVAESDSWVAGLDPLQISFDIKRIHGVGA